MKRRPAEGAVSIELEVPFHDVDGVRVVWHGWYCKYLELARTALLRARRLDVADVAGMGYAFYVIETHLRHLRPARYADRLRVTSWLTEVENRVGIASVVDNLTTGQRCTLGATVLVTTDRAGVLCLETPLPIRERLMGPGPGGYRVAGAPGGGPA